MSGLYLRFAAWVQEHLAVAEERLRSAKIAAALAEHQAEVEAVVSQMREGGASEHDITIYEAEQAVEETKMGTAEVKRSLHRRVKPGLTCLCCCRDLLPAGTESSVGSQCVQVKYGSEPDLVERLGPWNVLLSTGLVAIVAGC